MSQLNGQFTTTSYYEDVLAATESDASKVISSNQRTFRLLTRLNILVILLNACALSVFHDGKLADLF